MTDIKCYLYNQISGAHPKWTVAIQATGRKDADTTMKAHWGNYHFVSELGPGKIMADCGDITESASAIIRSRLEIQ